MQDRSQRLNSAAVQGDSLQQAQRMQRSLGSSATDPSPLVGQNSSMARKCVLMSQVQRNFTGWKHHMLSKT